MERAVRTISWPDPRSLADVSMFSCAVTMESAEVLAVLRPPLLVILPLLFLEVARGGNPTRPHMIAA